MKKTVLKFGLFLALGLTTTVFYSCDNDDDDNEGNEGSVSKIIATNVINSSTQITTAKVLAYWGDDESERDAIAQAPYKNKGFEIQLPETVPSKYLELISAEDAPQGITISDKNAKTLFLDNPKGFNGDEDEIGEFFLEEENDDSEHYVSWIYVDRDLTIKGEFKDIDGIYEDIEKYDLKLKKGWNVVYDSYTESYNNSTGGNVYSFSLTDQKPSGVNYLWYYFSYSSFRSTEATAKSVENKITIFSKLKVERNNRTRK